MKSKKLFIFFAILMVLQNLQDTLKAFDDLKNKQKRV